MTNRYQQLLLFLIVPLILRAGGAIAAPEETPSLTDPVMDPIIPTAVLEERRELSPLEVSRIKRKIDSLWQTGLADWQSPTPELAFDDWLRQLRLMQVLPDRLTEIEALSQIGAIAWENNYIEESRDILSRLDVIKENDFPNDVSLLIPLAEAYQNLRDSESAIALYQTHLDRLDAPYKADILRLIAQLAIDWFDYDKAIKAYQQIENLGALTIRDREQFGALYEKGAFYDQALKIQKVLPALYLQDQQIPELIDIYLKIATNNYRLQNYTEAIDANENAFALAWDLEYFETSETALQNLAQVYETQRNYPFAAQVYEQLLIVQDISYNRYGMMETYAQLSTVYQQLDQTPDALVALQYGLAIAKELNHNIDLFTQAIETLPSQ